MSDFGQANYGGNFKKTNYVKLKDGEQVYRILPPFGSLKASGTWSVYYKVHYGYKNSEGKQRPFQSCEERNQKNRQMIEVPDAALARINSLKAQLEEAKKAGNFELAQRIGKLCGDGKQLAQFNLESTHHMNAVDLKGNIVVLKLGHKAKLALDETLKTVRAKGIEPLSLDQGRYFTFRRSGMGLDTLCQVTVYQENIEVPGIGTVQKDLVKAFTEAETKALASQVTELTGLYPVVTAEQTARIVKEGATAVDEILGVKGKAGAVGNANQDNVVEEMPEETAAPVAAAPTAVPTQVTAEMINTAPVVQEARASVAASFAAPPAPAPALSAMSDDDFLASLNS